MSTRLIVPGMKQQQGNGHESMLSDRGMSGYLGIDKGFNTVDHQHLQQSSTGGDDEAQADGRGCHHSYTPDS
jgi:hypothetical protein